METNSQKPLFKINYNVVFLHVLGCVVFMCIPIFSGSQTGNPFADAHDHHYYDEIFEYALTIVFFYLNYYLLIPRLYFPKRYFLFGAMAFLGFIIVNFLPELMHLSGPMHHGGEPPFGPPPPPPPFGGGHGPRSFFMFHGMGPFAENFLKYTTVFILAITLKVTEKLKQIQKEKADSEVMFLKAQINPHFLFNTLNSIYALAVEAGASSTAKAIVQLSGMMRYATTEASTEKVMLSKELAYIDNYITLQRLRLTDKVKLLYTVDGDANGKEIAPFLLIAFIENAFKYGVSTDQDCDIKIQIAIEGGRLYLQVTNNKVYVANRDSGTSIGIHNTQKRLALLYPAKHKLLINETDTTFDITMQITL